MTDRSEKYDKLQRFIYEKGKDGVIIAFSGGVDSTTLAAISRNLLGDKAVAVTAKSSTYHPEELKSAKRIAKEIGIKHYIIETKEMANKNFIKNPENRCYYCKQELIGHLQDLAKKLGFRSIFEGTNFEDLTGHRPGFKAVKESENIFSPWAEAGFTKKEIRTLAKKLRLSVYDKPSSACLASRIPFGEEITEEKLERIGKAEQLVRRISRIRQLRVRDHNGLARIEVDIKELNLLFDVRRVSRVASRLKKLGFRYVTLDLEGYQTGSMLRMAETPSK